MSDTYGEVNTLVHCLHWDLYASTLMFNRFIPTRALRKHTSVVREVLWFAPLKKMSEQNRYGNVSFTIPMHDIVDRFGDKFYNIDSMTFSGRRCMRILLAKESYDSLTPVQTSSSDADLKKECFGRWWYKQLWIGVPNELELAIEVDTSDCEWLFQKCKMQANNHSLANSQGLGRHTDVCQRFNHFGKTCPFAFTAEETQEKLNVLKKISDSC